MPEALARLDTPLMRQYQALKSKYPHALMFFRLGDFYEMFGDDAKVAAAILDKVTGFTAGPKRSELGVLSDREMEVFMWIGKGYGSNQIARQLHMSVKTVETHRANIKLKLKLSSGNELLQSAIGWAQQMGEI